MQNQIALVEQSIAAIMGFADMMGEAPHRSREATTLHTLCLELEWRVNALRTELDGGPNQPCDPVTPAGAKQKITAVH